MPKKVSNLGNLFDAATSVLFDLFPTILDYLGKLIPENNGISLRSFIEGDSFEHDVVSYSLGRDTPNYMIRSGDLKLMMGKIEKNAGVDALYDLKANPLELRNLIVSPTAPEKNREQAETVKPRLVKWLNRHEPGKAKDLALRKLF